MILHTRSFDRILSTDLAYLVTYFLIRHLIIDVVLSLKSTIINYSLCSEEAEVSSSALSLITVQRARRPKDRSNISGRDWGSCAR